MDPAVATVRSAVAAALADLPAGALVLVACSGGADSLALAAATAVEARRAGLRAGAVTVDHGLQAGSAGRAAAVAALCNGLGLAPAEAVAVEVGGSGGPEAAARAARLGALLDARRRHDAVCVLLGHTRDDQAETVLLGLARGSGGRSLAGMAAVRGPFRRPLLGVDRATTLAATAAARLPVWSDPHNEDPAYRRARVRRTVLPVLEEQLGPGVADALARTADQLRDDADALDRWAAEAAAAARAADGSLDAEVLAALPRAVRTRVLRAAAVAAGAPADRLTFGHAQQLDALVTGWHGQGPLTLPGRLVADRVCGRIAITPTPPVGAEHGAVDVAPGPSAGG